jgi:rSAM/selenodomain-associated transferase 2
VAYQFPFSFIIPVLDEASRINELIDRLYRQFPDESFEILVVDGDASESTIQAIKHPEVVKLCSETGRGVQMNAGAKVAQGEILIFLHADTELPSNALNHIRQIMAEKKYVAGAFELSFNSERWVFKLIARAASWRYRLTRLPYGDQAIFMPQEYLFRIGGFAEIPIMEDLDLMRRIKKRKDKIYISKERVKTSARRWEKEGIIYCVLRTWILASLYCLGMSPDKLVKYYHHYKKY